MSQYLESTAQQYLGACISIGLALGVGAGFAFGDVAGGTGIGLAGGALLGWLLVRRMKRIEATRSKRERDIGNP